MGIHCFGASVKLGNDLLNGGYRVVHKDRRSISERRLVSYIHCTMAQSCVVFPRKCPLSSGQVIAELETTDFAAIRVPHDQIQFIVGKPPSTASAFLRNPVQLGKHPRIVGPRLLPNQGP